jgi:hypothetical protein
VHYRLKTTKAPIKKPTGMIVLELSTDVDNSRVAKFLAVVVERDPDRLMFSGKDTDFGKFPFYAW